MQVIEDLNAIAMRDGKPLEAVITEGMQHPNIVNTIAHTVQHTPHLQRRPHDSAQSSLAGTSDVPCKRGSLASRNKARQGVQSEGVAWLLLEYARDYDRAIGRDIDILRSLNANFRGEHR